MMKTTLLLQSLVTTSMRILTKLSNKSKATNNNVWAIKYSQNKILGVRSEDLYC